MDDLDSIQDFEEPANYDAQVESIINVITKVFINDNDYDNLKDSLRLRYDPDTLRDISNILSSPNEDRLIASILKSDALIGMLTNIWDILSDATNTLLEEEEE